MTEIVFTPPATTSPTIPATIPIDGRVPHFRYPFRMTSQGAATVEQDSIDDITQCVYALVATEIGSRQEEPEFGVTDQAFRQNGADLEELEAAAEDWEPRASLLPETAWDGLIETVTTQVSRSE